MARGLMEYNSQKEELEIPEYGRNVQNMVFYLKGIEDKSLRTKYAEEVINLFAIMYPANRHLADYREKLWNHLYRIAQYDLDLDIPAGITIHQKDQVRIKSHMPYPQTQFKNRHYGKYIQDMIKSALTMEGEKKEAYAEVIASYMKLAYRTWNKEHFVSDDIIIEDLKEMSENQLTFDDDYSIENLISMKNKLGVVQPAPTMNKGGWRNFGQKNKGPMQKSNKPQSNSKFKKNKPR
jgi:hypothetical protein